MKIHFAYYNQFKNGIDIAFADNTLLFIPTGTPISMLPVICPRQKATIAFPHPQTSRPGAERPAAVVPGGAAAVRITPTIPAARVRVPVFPAVHAPARVRAAAAPGAVPKTFIKLP